MAGFTTSLALCLLICGDRHPDRTSGERASNDAKECDVKYAKLCVVLAAFLVEIEATLIG